MRLFIFCLTFYFCVSLSAQTTSNPLQQEWSQQLGGAQFDFVSGLVSDATGNAYMAGYFYDSLLNQGSLGYADGFLAKYNNSGDLLWFRSFGGTDDDRTTGLAIDSSSQKLYLTGSFYGSLYWGSDSLQAVHRDDIFLLCIDSSGQWQWGKSYGGQNAQVASGLAINSNQEIYLHGYFEDSLLLGPQTILSSGLRDAFILKVDSIGQPLWAEVMGGPRNDEGLEIVFDEDLRVYMAGVYRDSATFGPYDHQAIYTYDGFLASWQNDGQWRWVKSFGGGYVDNCPALAYQKKLGRLIVGGWFFNDIQFEQQTFFAAGEEESFLAAYDTTGQLQWAKRFGEEFAELIYDIAIDSDDHIYAMGSFDSMIYMGTDTILAKHFNRPTDAFILSFENNGGYLWGFRTGDLKNDFGYQITLSSDSLLYLAGQFQDATVLGGDSLTTVGGYDLFLTRYFLDTTLIQPSLVLNLEQPAGWQIYPNPAKHQIQIKGQLPTSGSLLRVYDISGRLRLQEHYQKHQAISLEQLRGGSYWLQIGKTVQQLRILH